MESSKLAQRVKLTFYQMWKPEFALGHLHGRRREHLVVLRSPHVCCDVCLHTSVHMCTPLPHTKNVIRLRRLRYETQTQSWWGKKGGEKWVQPVTPSQPLRTGTRGALHSVSQQPEPFVSRKSPQRQCWLTAPMLEQGTCRLLVAHWDKCCISVIPALLWGTSSQVMNPKDCSPSSSEPVRSHHLSMLM